MPTAMNTRAKYMQASTLDYLQRKNTRKNKIEEQKKGKHWKKKRETEMQGGGKKYPGGGG